LKNQADINRLKRKEIDLVSRVPEFYYHKFQWWYTYDNGEIQGPFDSEHEARLEKLIIQHVNGHN